MSEESAADRATRAFTEDMAAAGIPVRADGPRLLYTILAVAGSCAGQEVPTGVSVTEVQNWPQIPPHWVHLPDSVTFPTGETNTDETDTLPEWKRHSRDLGPWDMTVPPATAWIRQVRGIVSAATGKDQS